MLLLTYLLTYLLVIVDSLCDLLSAMTSTKSTDFLSELKATLSKLTAREDDQTVSNIVTDHHVNATADTAADDADQVTVMGGDLI